MGRGIGKLDLGMKKRNAEQRSEHRRKSHLIKGGVLLWEKRVRWKMAYMIVRKEEWPESGRMTCIVDGCDNWGVGREEGESAEGWRFSVSLYFLLGVSRFGCGLQARGSMWVSIDTILLSISDNSYDGVKDQWDGGGKCKGMRQR